MKFISLVAFVFLVTNAHAHWKETKCSNSDGSVKWQEGRDEEDLIHLKYSNFIEGTLTLPIHMVSIQKSQEVTLSENTFKECSFQGSRRIMAAQVKIQGSEQNPDILKSHFPENMVQTEVICSTVESTPLPCPEER